ncbi:MAG TPA: protein kinase [Ktedonobacterales bacterium]
MSDQPSSDALIGIWLGACHIERRLGTGGMSAVYLAQQERPRRSVAVKVLRPQLLADARQWPLFLARFRREADATAALDHANIVPIYEFGEQDDLAYLVMPYLPDGSLAELLARQGPLTIAQTLAYIDQVASALDYAHQHGIVHRDVKPSNLLLHPDGRLLLADFGIARPLDQRDLPRVALASDQRDDAGLTVGGMALGTPDYMSPEQIRGERVGPGADIYALGVVCYAMLTGRSPFGGAPTAQVLGRQLYDAPPPLRTLRPDAPARLEEVVFWALAKDAQDRPPSAGAFAKALHDGARGALGALWKRAAGPAGLGLAAFRGAGMEPHADQPALHPGLAPAGDATLWDPSYHGVQSQRQFNQSFVAPVTAGSAADATAWPGARPRGGAGGQRRPGISPALLAAIGAALVMLVIMAVVVGNALGDSLGTAFGGPGHSSGPVLARPSPTATMTPTPTVTPSPTVPPNWLTATPDSLSLTCDSSGKMQVVTLTNQGPSSVKWSAQMTDSGVKLSSSKGSIPASRSIRISVTNNSIVQSHSGEIDFTPQSEDAGSPAVVTFTTQACGLFG